MFSLSWRTGALLVLLLILGTLLGAPPAAAQPFNCLPSCDVTDGRFLAISGSNLINLSENELNLTISVPAGTSAFQLGIFDGDAGELDLLAVSHWDTGVLATYEYTLYADPTADGTGGTVVNLAPGMPSILSSSMTDNGWTSFNIANTPAAQTPSGNYFYRLNIRLLTPALTTTNAFKLRTDAIVSGTTINPVAQPFSYIANLRGLADIQIVYPSYPSATPTRYDGSFTFYFDFPVSQPELALWDGDFDRGKFNGTELDTDDPDTPNSLPPWATPSAAPEGVAVGSAGTTGNPADDRNPAGAGIYNSKPPSVVYEVVFPDGQVFFNDNPSGNSEWEQFRISTEPFDPSTMDYSTTSIPPGIYQFRGIGVDMQNLNALVLPSRVLCVDDFGVPCTPLRPFLIGDTVFLDLNDNGVQDSGEPGIEGVLMELFDANGFLIGTAVTDADGHYSFEVEAYEYTVRIAPENFNDEGGILGGYTPTTPEECTETIVDGNVLTCDFGYRNPGNLGDRIWNDLNGDGVQDPDEPGIENVVVELLDEGGEVIGSQTTDFDGFYNFSNLQPGTYTVRVDTNTLPGGLAPTFDRDGIDTPHEATVELIGSETIDDIDFGYQANGSIGDRVWNDANGNGVQDAGEAGINGVTVNLLDGFGDVLASTVTDGDGDYVFDHLQEGTFTVQVDASTLPAGYTQTYDLDGLDTPHTAGVELAPGDSRTDVDFGYQGANASLGDRVWYDANGNGVQDGGEAGINGVTVQLADNGGNVVATTVTAGDGNYTFNGLAAGTYTVRIVAATLPAGLAPTYDLDGIGTPNAATVNLASNTDRTDVDFGYRGTASVGDRLWIDADGDGAQDAGETGINGATVELLDGGGNVVASTTTAGDGNYTFSNLAAGTYTVRVVAATLPAGLAQTYDLDGIGTANTAAFSLAAGANRTDVDFGYRGTASVGDRLWIDADGDGAQDAGETGINGATVELLDNGGNVVATTTTAGDGNYTFANLTAGSYSVRVVAATLPAGLAPTYDLDGIGTANTAAFSLAAGANRTDVDFGYRGTASVGDRLWIDADGDGNQDVGEAGINGVTVELLDNGGNVVATTTTAGDGNYTFANLMAGSYSVRVVAATLPAGLAPTYDLDGVGTPNIAAVSVAAGANVDNVDFGYRGTASVGDRIWNDADGDGVQDAGEAGINGVTVELLDNGGNVIASTTTAGDGNYGFANLSAGNYTVRVVSATLPAGSAPTYDLDGIGTANAASFALAAGANRTDVDFGYRGTASVGDRLWIDADGDGIQDAGETGINGVTVELLDNGGNVIASTTTAGDGNYGFANLSAGNYTVRVVSATLPAGLAPTYDLDGIGTANAASFALAAGANRTDVDFGYRGTASVGDRLWIDADGDGIQDAGETGINGVTVELLNGGGTVIASTVTAGDGNYGFANLSAGNYTVRVVAATLPAGLAPTYDLDGIGTANAASFSLAAGANRTDVDFGYRGTASVGDRIWFDADGDGIQDAGEIGINGVTVELLNGGGTVIASTVTAGDGIYGFANLSAGNYTVRVVSATLPAGLAPTYDLDGIGTANTASFALAAGANRTDVDFGYRGTASVGDRLWIDADGDGIQDAGETGINGVTVELLNGGGTVIASTVTAGDGNYGFANLSAGNYTVRVVAATLPAGLAPTYDLDGIGTANAASFALAAGANRADVDFGYRGTASVGDRIWFDADGDGIQDGGEAGINGVTVELLDGGGNVIASTTTAGDGNYGFANLSGGNYTVRVVTATLPPGLVQTYDLDGTGTANAASFSLAAGANRTDVDFGYRNNTGSIGDRVWNDENGDGAQDAGEAGFNGVTLELVDEGGNVVASTVTIGDGNYTFNDVPAGTYSVRVVSGVPPAFTPSYDLDGTATANIATFTLGAGINRTDVDFGYQPPPPPNEENCAVGSVSDPALNNGPNGHALYLPGIGTDFVFIPTPGSYVSNSDGTASLTGVARSLSNPNNAFTVEVFFSGYQATPPPGSPKKELFASAYVDQGGPIDPATWWYYTSFTGTLTGTGNYAGAVIELVNTGPAFQVGVGANNKNGNFGASGWFNWTVTSQPASGDLQATGMGDINVDLIDCVNGSIGDRIWNDTDGDGVQDAGETGINDVTVELLDGGGNVLVTTTTNGDGEYTFANLLAGNYSVRVVSSTLPAGLAPTYDLDGTATPNVAAVTVAAGANRTDVDFGYRGTASIGDRIWNDADGDGVQDAGETGLNGVTVELVDDGGNVIASTTTSGNGNYGFANLPAGDYTVRVVSSTLPAGVAPTYDLDGVASAHTAAVTLTAGQNRNDVDFGYRATGSIGNRVWNDTDGDGVQDAGETGLNSVTVELRNGGGTLIDTTTTSGDGEYSFTNLPAGTYSVRVVSSTLPPGVTPTYDLDGVATAHNAAVTLTAGQDRTDVDFGYRGTGSIGDRVWYDYDGDGVQDAGEPGLPGVTVELRNSGGTVIATQTTDSNGVYNFTNLAAGNYSVRVVTSTFPVGGLAPTYDLDGTGTPNTAAVTLGATSRTDVDFGYRGTRSLGDRVWNDTDGDGVQDASETGINGVTVRLFLGTTEVASTVTAGNGNYTFTNLPETTFIVRIDTATLPAGVTPTYDLDGTGTPHQATVVLTASRTDVDFGYRGTASVGDRIWNDADGDGVQDATETGINGVTVELLSGSTVIATTTTSGNGNYSFGNLIAGTYTVRVVSSTLPAGLTPTFDLDGTGTAHTATFALAAGATRTDVDFGYRTPPVTCTPGYVKDHFNSASFSNNDGTFNWAGAWIESDTAGAGVSSGNVTVGNPYAGYLFLRDYPDTGTQPSAARQVNLTGFSSATLSFAFHVRTAVDPDDAVVIEISNNGGASYTVLETLNGFSGTAEATRSYNISSYIASNTRVRFRVTNGYGASDELFKLDWIKIEGTCSPTTPQTGSIGNRVWLDTDGDGVQDSGEAGINGVTVQLLNSSGTVIATTTTAGNGDYTFGSLAAGSYSVRIVTSTLPAGAVQTYDLDGTGSANVAAVTLTTGQNRTDVDFGYRVQTVPCTAGYFKDHLNTASFSNNDGTLDWAGAWIESDSAGTGVSSGNVTVGNPYSGYLFLRDYPDTGTQPSAARQADLTGFSSATLSFSFHVRTAVDPDDAVVIEISKNGGSTYTVLETLNGFSGTAEATRSYNISSYIASNTRIRFRVSNGYGSSDELFKLDWVKIEGTCSPTPQNGSIGNRVWLDNDGDATQDSTEPGINGVTVQLLNSSGTVIATTTTAGNGDYTFSGLAAGNYSVRIVTSTLPTGAVQTYDLDGTGSAHVAAVSLAASQTRTDVDFGYRTPTSQPCTAGYFKDHFNSASFSNNDGTLSWAGAWIESDSAGAGVNSGNVTVGNPYSGYLFLRDYPDTGTQPSAARQANLAGFASAKLSFAFHVRTAVDPDDAVVIEVSKNGGTSYTVLETLDGFSGTDSGSGSYDISSYMASNTRIRFRVSGNYGASDELFKLDWVKIESTCAPAEQPGTGTIGYWKNHEEEWPVEQIKVGGKTYTQAQAITWMGTASSGDKTIDLFKQLVAAKLNVLIGNDSSCISSTISAADAWLVQNPLGSNVKASSTAWQTGGPLHTKLDDYNNGELCAPHRD